MVQYEYEVMFSYESVYIGTVVWVDELDEGKAISEGQRQVWEINGIYIDFDSCVGIKVTHTGTIGGK